MANILKLKRWTIAQAEESTSSSLYVMNKGQPRGNLNFTITTSANQRIGLQVPITWIPIDLSNFAQKGDVLRDPNFRRLVARGFLHIVDNKEAEQALLSEKATQEHNRIYDVVAGVGIEDEQIHIPVDAQINAQVAPSSIQNPFIENIILRATSESAGDLITELDGRLDLLSEDDIVALMNNVTSQEIKQWAVEAKAILAGE